jgi:ABC-type proline/glycine betaine transport system substrate-binding protein
MEENKKVKAQIIGADGNVFNLMGICARALKKEGYSKEADEMINRITTTAKSYDESLQIMMEYVVPVDQYNKEFESIDFDNAFEESIDI